MVTGLIVVLVYFGVLELTFRAFFTAVNAITVDSLYALIISAGFSPFTNLVLFILFLIISLLIFCLPLILGLCKYDPVLKKLKIL